MVRRGLRMVLDAEPDLAVVAEAGDGAEALEVADGPAIDLAVLDVAMPRMTGLQAAAELSRRRPELKLLMLSMYDNEQYLFEALKAGASGFVLKSAADRDLVRGLPGGHARRAVPLPGGRDRPDLDYLERIRAGDPPPTPADSARARGPQADR